MAQVAAHNPGCEIFGFDLWITPYAGVDNPGPEFVRQQMLAVGYSGRLRIISGPSRQTVPRFLEENPGMTFDIITVDGDHSDEGAWTDLKAVAPSVGPGGFLLFDDLLSPHHTLYPIWKGFRTSYQGLFQFAENLQDHWGTGIAYRAPGTKVSPTPAMQSSRRSTGGCT